MVPAPYVSLIRLSRVQMDGRVEGIQEISGKGGTSLNVEGAGNRTNIAQGVTPEKKGQVITVPIPTGGGSAPTPCLLYTSPSPRDATLSRMPSSA